MLDDAGITLNKNTIPNDPRSPFVTSGVRIGTPSVTTQGMKEPEMIEIAALIAEALRGRTDAGRARRSCRQRVADAVLAFPGVRLILSTHVRDPVRPRDRPVTRVVRDARHRCLPHRRRRARQLPRSCSPSGRSMLAHPARLGRRSPTIDACTR